MTGTPEILYRAIRSSASAIFCSGRTVTGSTIIPDSDLFTRSTSSACAEIERFLWMIPRPPCCAIAIARRDSVTVSIAAETIGMFSGTASVNRVRRSTSRGWARDRAGRSRTSSKVSASGGASPGPEEETRPRAIRLPPRRRRGTSCTSCRNRRDTGRSFRPSGRSGGSSRPSHPGRPRPRRRRSS